MKTSQEGIKFVTSNEGVVLHIYMDVAGKPTIGVGHLILPSEDFTAGLTLEQAEDLLAKDIAKVEMTLNALIPYNCTQNQFDALADFGFNLGTGALQTLLSHGWGEVPSQMLRWVYAGGRQIPGLLARRQREIALFNS